MDGADKAIRLSKRAIVIDEENSTREQPAEKSVKMEEQEPVTSPEVVRLQEEVRKLERNFQRACRAAREAELRAERAENLLDSKRELIEKERLKEKVEELEQNMAELTSQLKEARGRADNTLTENIELKKVIEVLKAEMGRMRREGNISDESTDNVDPVGDAIDRLSTVPVFTKSLMKKPKEEKVIPKEESIDVVPHSEFMGEIVGNEHQFSPNNEPIETQGEMEKTTDHTAAIPKFTPHKHDGSVHSALQCVLCEAHPKTARGYAIHLSRQHKTALKEIGLYLLCSCGYEIRYNNGNNDHNKTCDGRKFILHKLSDKATPSTPQCVECEAYPTTAYGYAIHLNKHHNTSLKSRGIYFICSCGFEVHSTKFSPDHSKKCDGKQYTLHKLDEE